MNSYDLIEYSTTGFDNQKYLKLQSEAIRERVKSFSKGRLYLEIGGKLLYDPHAARVLPGFHPKVKIDIFNTLSQDYDILYNVNAIDIHNDRKLSNKPESYTQATIRMAENMYKTFNIRPIIIVNLLSNHNSETAETYIDAVETLGYSVFKRYHIEGYPDPKVVLSKEGYGKDDYISDLKSLVLVTGAASNSGKMSTCLGQIYQDDLHGLNSGYAKYETFPIWELPLNHPINLAYEAATADIGDFNVIDKYHLEAYGKESVNYNRDVDAFEIIRSMTVQFIDNDNPMDHYKSPTDMGINTAGQCITDDQIVSIASLREIERRKGWYKEIVERGGGHREWITKCDEINNKALHYILERGYDVNLPI